MNHTAVRKLEFDAAHRLVNHQGKCRFLHGHRYLVEIFVAPKGGLDSLGMVVDFGVVKEKVGAWIDEFLDHTTILSEADLGLIPLVATYCKGGQPYIMPKNPTAENIAAMLLQTARELLKGEPIYVCKVVVHETPNCRAEVENGNIL